MTKKAGLKLFGHFFDRIGTFFEDIFWMIWADGVEIGILIGLFTYLIPQIFFEKILAGSKLSDKLTVPRR